MKILYVTRHFNHSGYIIFKKMLEENIEISAILLKDEFNVFKVPFLRYLAIFVYYLKTKFYNGQFIKTINSEEILARKKRIRIIKTKSIKNSDFFEQLKKLNPDLIVLGGGWHELIPKNVFTFPKYGCINTHPSMLPEFRGTSITRWQVLNGVEISGSTIHFVDDHFDTGGSIAQSKIKVDLNWTPQKLFELLGESGADLMVDLLKKNKDEFNPKTFFPEHNKLYYKYYSKWKWDAQEITYIDWNKPLNKVHSIITASSQESYQYSGPKSKINGVNYYIRKTEIIEKKQLLKHEKLGFQINEGKTYAYINCQKELFLIRSDENWVLHLCAIQEVKNNKYKRAYKPLKKLKIKNGNIFNDLL